MTGDVLDWQLKHARMLPFRQYIEENRASVRKRQSVMMLVRRPGINHAKPGNAKAGAAGEQPVTIVPDLIIECEFGSRQQAYRDTRLLPGGEAAR
jgi:hypothetical protein